MHREKDHGEGVNVSIKSLRWNETRKSLRFVDTSFTMKKVFYSSQRTRKNLKAVVSLTVVLCFS